MKTETIITILKKDEQSFIDENEINNRFYTFSGETTENDFFYGDFSFTDISIDEMKEAAKSFNDDEMGIIIMSDENLESYLDHLYPDETEKFLAGRSSFPGTLILGK